MAWVGFVLIVIAVVAWTIALWNGFGMLQRREPGRSLIGTLANGFSFYTGRGFTPAAAPYRRRFLLAVAAFFGALLLAMVIGLLTIEGR